MWECAHGGMLRKRNFQPGDIFPSFFSRRDSHAFRRFLSSFFYIISSHWMRRAHLHLNAFPKTSLKWGRIHPVRLTCVGFLYFLMLRETFANLFACLGGTRTFTDFTFKLRYDVLPPWLKPTLASRLLVLLDAPSRTARQVKDLWVDLCTPLYTLNRYIYVDIGGWESNWAIAIIGVSVRTSTRERARNENECFSLLDSRTLDDQPFLRWNFINITWGNNKSATNISASSSHFHVALLLFPSFTRPQRTCARIIYIYII